MSDNTTGNNLQSGLLDLYDYCLPPLSAGEWTIKTSQTITWNEKGINPSNASFNRDQVFNVAGPRFTIDPSEVHAVYPPANAQGLFENILPHIVLSKRTLPWERPISGSPDLNNPTPWMALMVLDSSEIVAGTGKAQPQSMTVNDLINSPTSSKILGPQGLENVSSEDLSSPCYIVDIDPTTFMDIIPKKTELPFLSHCRKVSMKDKEPQAEVYQENGEGWYSVTVANRLPMAPDGADTGKAFCCLVSLEGFEDYLYGASKAGDVANYNAVRMAVLAFWSFTVLPQETQNFATLMQNVNSCLLKMPLTPAATNTGTLTKAEELVTAALSDGYVPMTYETRVGEKTVAWYRGPFSPVILEENTAIMPFFSAESALIYDETTGMFDASYSVAWQIGRLLALSDGSFSQGMLQWRKQQNQNVNASLQLKHASPEVLSLLDLTPQQLHLTPPEDLQDRIKDVFAKKLASIFDKEDALDLPPIMVRDKTGVLNRKEQLPGVLSPKQLLEAITSKEAFYTALKEEIFNS